MPALHTFLGGIFINELCGCAVPGLFASSESATGMHGSNRLSGNAIASCMVLGASSGKSATLFAASHNCASISEAEVAEERKRMESFRGDGGLDPYEVEREIKNLAWESAGVVRNEGGLRAGGAGFEEMRREKMPLLKGKDQRSWIKALDCANLAQVGEMVTKSALERREFRGQHYRDDYPTKEDGLPKWVKIYKNRDDINCHAETIPFAPGDLLPEVKRS